MINHKDLYLNRQSSQIAKFSKDSEKWINAKTDEDLINILLIWVLSYLSEFEYGWCLSLLALGEQVVVNSFNPGGLHLLSILVDWSCSMRKSSLHLTLVSYWTFIVEDGSITFTISIGVWTFISGSVVRYVDSVFSIFLSINEWSFISADWFLKNSLIYE